MEIESNPIGTGKKIGVVRLFMLILISVCLIILTIISVVEFYTQPDQYFSRNGFIVKISEGGKHKCFIPIVDDERTIDIISDKTGLYPCF